MKSSRGFTLIEVLVAAAVLAMACTALFGLLSRSLFNLHKIEDMHRYQLAAEDVMTRVLYLSTLPGGGQTEGKIDGLDAQWRVSISPWQPRTFESKPGDAIVKIDVDVVWPGRSGQRNIRLEAIKAASLNYENYDLGEAIETAFPR